jgi:hypothetical protein
MFLFRYTLFRTWFQFSAELQILLCFERHCKCRSAVPFSCAIQQCRSAVPFSSAIQLCRSAVPFSSAVQQCHPAAPFSCAAQDGNFR